MKKIILIGVLALVIVLQFFRIDKVNPKVVLSNDFIEISQPEQKIQKILRTSCYDCHSNETNYPWYSSVAPISWWLADHIEEAREHLNFSEWGNYNEKKQKHKLHECYEEVEEGEMPLESYTWTHSEANLTNEEREYLENWFKSFGPFEDAD